MGDQGDSLGSSSTPTFGFGSEGVILGSSSRCCSSAVVHLVVVGTCLLSLRSGESGPEPPPSPPLTWLAANTSQDAHFRVLL
eukprot:2829509-Amphidinium_carterae.1